MLATTVLLLLLGWLCCTTVMAIRATPPREEVHRATAGPLRAATPVHRAILPTPFAEQDIRQSRAAQVTVPQPHITLPQPRLRELVGG